MRKKIGILHSKKKNLQKLALKSEPVFLIVLFVLVVYIDLNKKIGDILNEILNIHSIQVINSEKFVR